MRGKFQVDAETVDAMEAALCAIQEAVDDAADMLMTAEMSNLFGLLDESVSKLHRLNNDRREDERPDDDRAAQALGRPDRSDTPSLDDPWRRNR